MSASGEALIGGATMLAPLTRHRYLYFCLIAEYNLYHALWCSLLTESCLQGAFTSIPSARSPVSVWIQIQIQTAGWSLAPQAGGSDVSCRSDDNCTDIKSLTGRSFICCVSFPRAPLRDFTGGSRIHDLFPLRGSPWELCRLPVLLGKSTLPVSNLDRWKMSSFFTS